MMNNMDWERQPERYVMNEKLKDKNKNAQWFVLFSIVYHKSIKALVCKL